MSRKTERVVIKSQARGIISKVYDFMKKEASNNYAEKLTDARWRTAQAVGVSERTISRILRERKEKEDAIKASTADTNEESIDKGNNAISSQKDASTNTPNYSPPMKIRRVSSESDDVSDDD